MDGKELRNYKSTEAYNYLHSNNIGKVLLKKHSDFIGTDMFVEVVDVLHKKFLKKTFPELLWQPKAHVVPELLKTISHF